MILFKRLNHVFYHSYRLVHLPTVLIVPFVIEIFAAVGFTGWLSYPSYRLVHLRTVLIVPFVIEIFAAVGFTGWLSYRNGQNAVNRSLA